MLYICFSFLIPLYSYTIKKGVIAIDSTTTMRVSQGSVLQFPFDSYQKHAPLSATFSYSDPETGELVVTYLNFVLKVCFCMGFSVSSVWACMLNLYFTI